MRPFIKDQLRYLLDGLSQAWEGHEICSLSPSVYDTAWVAMVQKPGQGPIFPECLSFLLTTQLEDGSWASETSDIDGILSTLAALLALRLLKGVANVPAPDIEERCARAEASLRCMFATWKVGETERVGFELLLPSLLRPLEDDGIRFEFPSRDRLMILYEAKMHKARAVLVGPNQTTLLHSLEAFSGSLDFDQVTHHKMPDGSMFGSPSSTAAYLLNRSVWDDDAEGYLRRVMEKRNARWPHGACPSAFPTTIFEMTWAMSVLLESGISLEDLGNEMPHQMTAILEEHLAHQSGLLGFAPSYLPDVDDTSKAVTLLSILGRPQDINPLISHFEGEACFLTYQGERNPSISANCNALSCLLRSSRPADYVEQIVKCSGYISMSASAGNLQDKWNNSALYSMMLISQTFTLLLEQWQEDIVLQHAVPKKLLQRLLPGPLLQILHNILNSQSGDGSWNSKHEETSYAILALASLLRLPWIDNLRMKLVSSIRKGKEYLDSIQDGWMTGDYLWIEKVAYASSNLSLAYCIAASAIEPPTTSFGKLVQKLCYQPQDQLEKLKHFFTYVPPFSAIPDWKLELYLAQSLRLVPLLEKERFRIFPRLKVADEKYLVYIPFTWIGCHNVCSSSISHETLWEMMLISLFNFQVDAYMETVLEENYRGNLKELKALICRIFVSRGAGVGKDDGELPHQTANGIYRPKSCFEGSENEYANGSEPELFRGPEVILRDFVSYILQHPRVLQSPAHLQRWLAYEMKAFLLDHLTQLEDCVALQKNSVHVDVPFTIETPRTSYHDWVRTTGANHTSCPYSFVFFLCLTSSRDNDSFCEARQRYVLEDMCRHLATLCRQYNDFGSILRDRQENNLNSINFPEFRGSEKNDPTENCLETEEERRKQELLRIIDYGRQHLNLALETLKQYNPRDSMRTIDLFVSVTDLYGQIYVAKDIGMRKMADGQDGTVGASPE